MFVKGIGQIDAVGFDIDGTLYRQWKLHARMIFHFFRYNQFFFKYGFTRAELHRMSAQKDFARTQSELLAKRIGCSPEKARERLDRIVYKGLAKFFERIKPCPFVQEAFAALKGAGLKIALLSDFPPEQKGELWGLKKYCDVILGAEEIGALKPSRVPFDEMAKRLGASAERVLYVGNSAKYDARGAKGAGMKTALLVNPVQKFFRPGGKCVDIYFSNYRQFMEIMLQ